MKGNQAMHATVTMCPVLGVSTSGYWAWRKRPLSEREKSDRAIEAQIEEIHRWSQGTYGVPRMHAELAARGTRVGRKRVARLMRRAGFQGVTRRKGIFTTVRDREARPAPDLVSRNFVASESDELWVADITYIPTWAGFLYLAVVIDAWSRRVIGWAMENHLRTELVLQALNMALYQRRPSEVIHHSDQGCQYTSIAFGVRCREAGVRPSMGSVGDAYDNALAESFFATLECELLDRRRFKTPARQTCGAGRRNGLRMGRTKELDQTGGHNAVRSDTLNENPHLSTKPGQVQDKNTRGLRSMCTIVEMVKWANT